MNTAFYQLRVTPLERALPKLLEKVYESGKRVHVLCQSLEHLGLLNTVLWTYSPTAFLPHGAEGIPMDHPIWLSCTPVNANKADILVVTNGYVVPADLPYERVLDLFHSADEEALHAARERFKYYKSLDYELTFWRQNDQGGWEN